MFREVRKAGKHPNWVGEDVYEGLLRVWSTPNYEKVCERAKKKRSSDYESMGSSKYTNGALPRTEYVRLLGIQLGREPTTAEIHKATHQWKSTGEWFDAKLKYIQDNFENIKETQTQRQGGITIQERDLSDFELWTEAARGKRKGRVYGSVSQAQAYKTHRSYIGKTSTSHAHDDEIRRQVDAFLLRWS